MNPELQKILDQIKSVEEDIALCQKSLDDARLRSVNDAKFQALLTLQQVELDSKKTRVRIMKEAVSLVSFP